MLLYVLVIEALMVPELFYVLSLTLCLCGFTPPCTWNVSFGLRHEPKPQFHIFHAMSPHVPSPDNINGFNNNKPLRESM